jgi:hypothetical protein
MYINKIVFLLYFLVLNISIFSNDISIVIRKCEIPLSIVPMLSEHTTTNRYKVDFKVDITNVSNKKFKFNSLLQPYGYQQLKFVLTDGDNEYWITRYPHEWFSTYLSFFYIEPGQKYIIPIAFSDDLWAMDKIIKNPKINGIRAVFDQPYWYASNNQITNNQTPVWHGIESSKYYSITNVLRAQTISNVWYGVSGTNINENIVPTYHLSGDKLLSNSNKVYEIDFDDEVKVDISL